MHKKAVLNVDQETLSFSAKRNRINNASDVTHVKKLSFGEISLTKNIVKNIGSNYGLKKVIVSANFVTYLDIVILRLKALRNIGLIKLLKNIGTIKQSNTLSMMGPIFIKMVV